MTKKQAITRVKHSSMYKDDRETADYIIKALEQQPCDDCVSRKAMLDAITEIDGNINMDIYTNEVREIIKSLPPVTPTFPSSEDCVSREDVKQFVEYIQSIKDSHNTKGTPINFGTICDLVIRGWKLMDLPPVTPTHGTCKDCRHREGIDLDASFCAKHGNSARNDFYCADYEKRGNENG